MPRGLALGCYMLPISRSRPFGFGHFAAAEMWSIATISDIRLQPADISC
jgi:hypothetical protein